MPRDDTSADWLTVREVAEQLGVSLKVVYRLVQEGRFEADWNLRRSRIRSVDLDAFISAHRIQPGTIGPSLQGAPRVPNGRRRK